MFGRISFIGALMILTAMVFASFKSFRASDFSQPVVPQPAIPHRARIEMPEAYAPTSMPVAGGGVAPRYVPQVRTAPQANAESPPMIRLEQSGGDAQSPDENNDNPGDPNNDDNNNPDNNDNNDQGYNGMPGQGPGVPAAWTPTQRDQGQTEDSNMIAPEIVPPEEAQAPRG